jgi:hypothetical protein
MGRLIGLGSADTGHLSLSMIAKRRASQVGPFLWTTNRRDTPLFRAMISRRRSVLVRKSYSVKFLDQNNMRAP